MLLTVVQTGWNDWADFFIFQGLKPMAADISSLRDFNNVEMLFATSI